MHGRHEVRSHFEQKHRQRQHRGKLQRATKAREFGLARRGLAVGRGGIGFEPARRIAGAADRGFEIRRRDKPAAIPDAGAFGREIDACGGNAGNRPQRLFDMADARGAGHALDPELDLDFGHRITGLFDCLHHRQRIGRARKGHIGAFGREIDADAGDRGELADRLFDMPDA